MSKRLNGQWPILVFVLMFLIIPLSTFPGTGVFELIFAVLAVFAVLIASLVIASVVTARRQTNGEAQANSAIPRTVQDGKSSQ